MSVRENRAGMPHRGSRVLLLDVVKLSPALDEVREEYRNERAARCEQHQVISMKFRSFGDERL